MYNIFIKFTSDIRYICQSHSKCCSRRFFTCESKCTTTRHLSTGQFQRDGSSSTLRSLTPPSTVMFIFTYCGTHTCKNVRHYNLVSIPHPNISINGRPNKPSSVVVLSCSYFRMIKRVKGIKHGTAKLKWNERVGYTSRSVSTCHVFVPRYNDILLLHSPSHLQILILI